MEIHFLGVGEACDARHSNTSILLKSEADKSRGRILLDCGFSVPHRYFSLDPDPEELEILWVSHFHGDHFFGTPLLLLRLWEMGRKKSFCLAGPPGIKSAITEAVSLAYPNLLSHLGFALQFIEIEPGKQENIADALWRAAYNEHPQPCLALRLEISGRIMFYSGDGRPTPMTRSLAEGCDIIIHEAYGLADSTPGHGSIETCLDFARTAGVNRLALVHMQRDIRPQATRLIQGLEKKYPEITIMLPGEGSTIFL